MIWLTWRQFRSQALAALIAVGVIAIYLVVLGLQVRSAYDSGVAGCQSHGTCGSATADFTSRYDLQLTLLNDLLIAAPGVIGIFWGAPLVTRELEAGTHRLVWNQSVTRGRWLAVKLLVIGLLSIAVTGLLTLLLTWSVSPIDQISADRFSPTLFATRNITPLGYAAFAFVLGTCVGIFIRRTVPAMAVTLVVFAGVQVLMPTVVRENLVSPSHSVVAVNEQVMTHVNGINTSDNVHLWGYKVPGGWVTDTSAFLDSSGQPVPVSQLKGCLDSAVNPHALGACLEKKNLHVNATFQPASHYWTLQWTETLLFLVLTGVLAALSFWRVRLRLI
ncbi:ABC transporter permease subunit [Streptomyces mirabilis]|uniref:ABC transporter permease subunit n=1 Tax=Streptomyces mirabilis TaxID=68239 RepID=UPI003668ED5E